MNYYLKRLQNFAYLLPLQVEFFFEFTVSKFPFQQKKIMEINS